MSKALHIFISPQTLFTVGGYEVSNTLFTSFLVTAVVVTFLLIANRLFKKTNHPTGVQNVLELVVDGITSLIESTIGRNPVASAVYPLISAFLLFIALNNLAALLPGFHTLKYTGKPTVELEMAGLPSWVRMPQAFASTVKADPAAHEATPAILEEESAPAGSHESTATAAESSAEPGSAATAHAASQEVDIFRGANADVSLTIALAIISVVATQYFGLRFAHLAYLKKFFNFSSPINFAIGLLELFLEMSKVMSFGFRLFGNIFAGEVLISVIKFLVPIILPIPFLGIEVFVGCLQAYVFAMLSLVFFQMAATSEHH